MNNHTTRLKGIIDQHKKQGAIYFAFGLVAFIADYTVLRVGLHYGFSLLLATTCGVTVGFIVSYLANNFRIGLVATTKNKKKSLPLYTALFVWNILFSYLFIKVFQHFFALPVIIPKALSVAVIVSWNYLLFRYIFTSNEPMDVDHMS